MDLGKKFVDKFFSGDEDSLPLMFLFGEEVEEDSNRQPGRETEFMTKPWDVPDTD